MIHRESKSEYHVRQAISAGFCWDIVKADGCPAQAWFDSCFNPDRPPQPHDHNLEFGELVHLAVLEPDLLKDRILIIDAPNFRTKAAQELRDEAYIQNKVPLLFESEKGYSFQTLTKIRKALEESDAAELLFGEGENEVSYTWEIPDPWQSAIGYQHSLDSLGLVNTTSCKARADRLAWSVHAMVDLKSADNASQSAFERAITRYGHHLRGAWYLDGWNESPNRVGVRHEDNRYDRMEDYLFVVVGKSAPHLVQTYRLDDRSLEWGRMLYRKALKEIRMARETGGWRGYSGDSGIITASLPAFAEQQLADMAMEGEL